MLATRVISLIQLRRCLQVQQRYPICPSLSTFIDQRIVKLIAAIMRALRKYAFTTNRYHVLDLGSSSRKLLVPIQTISSKLTTSGCPEKTNQHTLSHRCFQLRNQPDHSCRKSQHKSFKLQSKTRPDTTTNMICKQSKSSCTRKVKRYCLNSSSARLVPRS